MPKMSDVAKLANVSTATVSRVLSKSGLVTDITKLKVMEAIKELNYHPNILARHLRKMQTNTVVTVVPDLTNTFFSKVLRGIEAKARENGYRVLLGDTGNNENLEYEYLEVLHNKQADGMILLAARIDRKIIEEMSKKYPIVLACEYIEGSNLPTVSIDNVSSARKATEHLLKLGHRRIAHLSGPMNVILSRDRLKGYRQALDSWNIEIDPLLIQEGDFYYKTGYNLMLKLLSIENPPTAVFSANDEMAIGAIKAAQEQGLRIPAELAIIGFDNIQISEICSPALTTIAQPAYKLGETAMKLLNLLIKGETIKRRQVVLDDELVIRESCGYSSMTTK